MTPRQERIPHAKQPCLAPEWGGRLRSVFTFKGPAAGTRRLAPVKSTEPTSRPDIAEPVVAVLVTWDATAED